MCSFAGDMFQASFQLLFEYYPKLVQWFVSLVVCRLSPRVSCRVASLNIFAYKCFLGPFPEDYILLAIDFRILFPCIVNSVCHVRLFFLLCSVSDIFLQGPPLCYSTPADYSVNSCLKFLCSVNDFFFLNRLYSPINFV